MREESLISIHSQFTSGKNSFGLLPGCASISWSFPFFLFAGMMHFSYYCYTYFLILVQRSRFYGHTIFIPSVCLLQSSAISPFSVGLVKCYVFCLFIYYLFSSGSQVPSQHRRCHICFNSWGYSQFPRQWKEYSSFLINIENKLWK